MTIQNGSTLDHYALTGHRDIDAAHAEIAQHSEMLLNLLKADAPLSAVEKAFWQFDDAMRTHFQLEEDVILSLAEHPDVGTHYVKHLQNHNVFRDMLTYGAMKLAEGESRDLRDILRQIAGQYFDEVLEMDLKLTELMVKYALVSEGEAWGCA